ncbi:MAG: hypothetical protein GF398_01595 [Chitinivibrionales bacterium]|nr:hypothetical protein [Chitinivibrionales bacterium]
MGGQVAGGAMDTQQLQTIGITSVVIAGFILVLTFIVPGAHSKIPFLFITAFTGSVGGAFLIAARKLAGKGPAETVQDATDSEAIEFTRTKS